MDDEELEYTLLNKREVMVYQIPPASSSSGHKADDWKKCIWRGRCQIAGKGPNVVIKLLDASSGNLFAQCMIPNGEYDKYVERVVDSSRYFVLKITNGQRHAFIGLGFEDRNDAFDFNCTLSDFKSTWVDRDKPQEEEAPKPMEPAKDLSLKDGQKITINIGGLGVKSRRPQAESNGDGGGFIGLLAPPPPGGSSRKQPGGAAQAAPAAAPLAAPAAAPKDDAFDDFGDFDDFQSSSAPAAPVPVAPAPAPVASAAPVAAAPPRVDDLSAQFGGMGLGGDPFGGAKPAPAPAANGMGVMAAAPAPAAAAPPQAAFADPFAAGPAAPSQPQPQPQVQNNFFAPAAQPPPMTQPQQPAQAKPSFDPFGGLGGLGGLGGGAPAMAPAPVAAAAPPKAAPGKSDPFDEFDIFK